MSRKEDMVVGFVSLKSGRYTYHFTLDGAFLSGFENDELRGGKVEVEAEMEKNERVLMFRFRLRGEVETWCDRCLGDIKVPIEGEEQLEVRFSDSEMSDEENVAVLPEGASEIDLSQWLYEYVAVRMPMQHRHEEGGCDPEVERYMVGESDAEEGSERAIDPRWEALKALK